MIRHTLTAVIFLILSETGWSQKKTFLGIEANLTSDHYVIDDGGNQVKKVPLLGILAGITVRQEICTKVFVETGVFWKSYDEGVGFKIESGYGTSTGFNAWVIPFRIGTTVRLSKKLNLVPVIGYSFCINQEYDYGAGGGSGWVKVSSGDSLAYNYTTLYKNKTFSLLQTGAALQFKFFKKGILNVAGNYYTGLTKVTEQNVYYTLNNSPAQNAKIHGKGQFWSVGVSMLYPISRLWTKIKPQKLE